MSRFLVFLFLGIILTTLVNARPKRPILKERAEEDEESSESDDKEIASQDDPTSPSPAPAEEEEEAAPTNKPTTPKSGHSKKSKIRGNNGPRSTPPSVKGNTVALDEDKEDSNPGTTTPTKDKSPSEKDFKKNHNPSGDAVADAVAAWVHKNNKN